MKINTKYKETYDEIAYKTLSSKALRTLSHLGSTLNCSVSTLEEWISEFPSFAVCVDRGFLEGEKKFRNILSCLSILPSSGVNTKLLCTLGENVYGIKSEDSQVVTVNTVVQQFDPEKEMRDRGIPIPDIGLEDTN